MTGEKKLSYTTALAAIGAYLDRQQYQELVLCELDDGYVIRARQANGTIEAIALADEDLRDLAARLDETASPNPHPQDDAPSVLLRTTGAYTDFLGALGRQCDLLNALNLSVVELADHVLLTFRRRAAPEESGWREYLFDVPGIQQLLFSSGVPIVRA